MTHPILVADSLANPFDLGGSISPLDEPSVETRCMMADGQVDLVDFPPFAQTHSFT